MKSKATLALALSLVVLVALSGHAQTAGPEQKVQTVKLTVGEAGGYVLTPSKLTKGVPVKMDVDLKTVKGCARTVVITAFNVKKTVKDGDTTVQFTPDKAGTIDIVCGMNMVKGTFTVSEPQRP